MKTLAYFFLIITLNILCNNSSYSSSNERSSDYNDSSDEEEGFMNDTYSATVDYYNPQTGYSATYDLEVEVEDNEVSVIHFPNDGYLDDDHI